MTRIATFNLENLFVRPAAMNQSSDSFGATAIEDHALANNIVNKDIYSEDDKRILLELSQKYKWHNLNPPTSSLITFQKIRGQLFKVETDGDVLIVAKGRKNWVGWFELRKEDVSWRATYNTARVIKETEPDILITVEVENRPTLEKFNAQVLKSNFGLYYPHIMVVDANDMRGIDLGIMSKYPITRLCSHCDEVNANGEKTFSRDCPEYDITLPNGKTIVVIPNHFKSKRNGDDQQSKQKRILQAKRAHEIAINALGRSDYVIIGGDLNDIPDSDPIKELFKNGFFDVKEHASYPADRPGTYETGLANQKIDYLILSPELGNLLNKTGIERRGSYHPRTWEPFDTVANSTDEASDHHLVWADFNF